MGFREFKIERPDQMRIQHHAKEHQQIKKKHQAKKTKATKTKAKETKAKETTTKAKETHQAKANCIVLQHPTARTTKIPNTFWNHGCPQP